MVKLANKQTIELWNHLRQGFEEILNFDENRLPVKSVNQVSSSYKCSVLLSGYVFQIRLLKNTLETNLDTDLVHEIELYYDRELGRISFKSVTCNQKTGKRNVVSAQAYLPSLNEYVFKQILTDLVENVSTIKQVEYLNLGVHLSGLGFDVVEEIRYE
jgi:hypothetical protein